MSESVSSSDRLNAVLSYFGVLAVVGIVAAMFALVYNRSGENIPAVSAELAAARVKTRETVIGEGRAVLASAGKNADGTYRIPAGRAVEVLIANPAAALAAARAPEAKPAVK